MTRHACHMTSPPELHLAYDHLNIGHASSVKDLFIGDSVGIWNTEDGSCMSLLDMSQSHKVSLIKRPRFCSEE